MLPRRIWTIEDYYQAKDFYETRGLIFNPALEYGSPAAAHVIAQAQLRSNAAVDRDFREVKAVEPSAAMDSANAERDLVFVSYSHKDKKFLNDLLAHLKPYVRNGSISAWSDRQIQPGSKWLAEIQRALAAAKVAVLLVSKDFLASDFIQNHELGPLLKEAKSGGVTLLWVLIRACSFHESPINDVQAAYPPDKPLAEMKAERDRAWVAICQEVKKAVNALQGSHQAIPTPNAASSAKPRRADASSPPLSVRIVSKERVPMPPEPHSPPVPEQPVASAPPPPLLQAPSLNATERAIVGRLKEFINRFAEIRTAIEAKDPKGIHDTFSLDHQCGQFLRNNHGIHNQYHVSQPPNPGRYVNKDKWTDEDFALALQKCNIRIPILESILKNDFGIVHEPPQETAEEDTETVDAGSITEDHGELVLKCKKVKSAVSPIPWKILRTLALLGYDGRRHIPISELFEELGNNRDYYRDELRDLKSLRYICEEDGTIWLEGNATALLTLRKCIDDALFNSGAESPDELESIFDRVLK